MESTKQEEQGIYAATPPATGLLERLFKLRQHGTTVRTELAAGLTTFITMAYIIFVNPNIMADAGIDHGAAFVATCLAAALGCFLMGLYANWPVGLAPGMGLNAFFTYTVVGTMGYSWQIALGAVFISGVMFMLLTFSRVREWLLNSIPRSLRFAMGAGVGLFLGLIGLKTAGIVVASPATLIKLGHLTSPGPLLAALCFLMIAVLEYRRVFGGILISILSVTLVGWALGLVQYGGVFSAPPSLAPTFLAMDIAGAFNVTMISVILAFLFVHMFDTAGTLMGVAQRAHLVKEDGRIENLSKAMKADSASSVFGGMLGVPPVTSYVESAAGVAAGGRTGLTAVVVGVLFVAAITGLPILILGQDPDSINLLLLAAALAWLLAYIIAHVDVLALRRRYPHIARPFRTPFYPLPQLFGIAGMIYAVVHVSPTPEMTGRIFASAGVVLGVVSLVAVVWIKGVMRKPLFVPEPLETAGETAQGKSVALDPLQSPSA